MWPCKRHRLRALTHGNTGRHGVDGREQSQGTAWGKPEPPLLDTVPSLFVVTRPLPWLVFLITSGKGSSPGGRKWRDWNMVGCWGTVSIQARATSQAAGRGPGSTWFFEILYHTPRWRLTRVQAFMCGIPLAIVILHRWLGPIVFRARVSDS